MGIPEFILMIPDDIITDWEYNRLRNRRIRIKQIHRRSLDHPSGYITSHYRDEQIKILSTDENNNTIYIWKDVMNKEEF